MNDLNVDNEELKIDREKVKNDFQNYRLILQFLGSNVPIQALCLPKEIENALISDGCLRICDMVNRDLSKIKGIGKRRLDLLTARMDEFFSISI